MWEKINHRYHHFVVDYSQGKEMFYVDGTWVPKWIYNKVFWGLGELLWNLYIKFRMRNLKTASS